jgi:hypothetical protein
MKYAAWMLSLSAAPQNHSSFEAKVQREWKHYMEISLDAVGRDICDATTKRSLGLYDAILAVSTAL